MNAARNALDTKITDQAEQQARAWLMEHLGAYNFGGEMLRSLTTLLLATEAACFKVVEQEIARRVNGMNDDESGDLECDPATLCRWLREQAQARRTG